MTETKESTAHGPWNPGIRSQLPAAFLPLATIFRPENVVTSLEEAYERSAFTGLEPEDHVVFRPERLAVHEVLIRVTGDVSVPDGPNYEDLGINFREITRTILAGHIEPRMAEIVRAYDDLRERVVEIVGAELAAALCSRPDRAKAHPGKGGLLRLFGGNRTMSGREVATESLEERERRILAEWRAKAERTADPLEASVYRVLFRLASAIQIRHGRLRGDPALLTAIAAGMVGNEHGSELIGRLIDPHLRRAAAAEGYRLLPAQARPVVMNVKGASASGKSTMRPLQRQLAEAVGVRWSDFALISPDIWRKYLLDYGSLGAAAKYAGTLTGQELKIVDEKLDRYMDQKAERGQMPHLLIDRFRFDSFALELGRGGRQPAADPVRPPGLHVLHDHAAGCDRRARLAARPAGRPLQGGRRPARPQHRGLHRHAAPVLHLGAAGRQEGPLRVPRQQRARGAAAEDRRLRLERRDEHPGRQVPARRRALPQDRRPGQIPGGGLSRRADRSRPPTTWTSCASAHAACRRSTSSSATAAIVYARMEAGRITWTEPVALARATGRRGHPRGPRSRWRRTASRDPARPAPGRGSSTRLGRTPSASGRRRRARY